MRDESLVSVIVLRVYVCEGSEGLEGEMEAARSQSSLSASSVHAPASLALRCTATFDAPRSHLLELNRTRFAMTQHELIIIKRINSWCVRALTSAANSRGE